MRLAVRTLTAAFWVSLATPGAWISASAPGAESIVGGLGEGATRAVDTLLYAVLALTSGLLVLYHRITTASVDPDRYQTLSETFYAFALFFALFFGIYSSLGWYY